MASDKEKVASEYGPGVEVKRNSAGEIISFKFRCCVGRDEQYRQIWRTSTLLRKDPRIANLTPGRLKKEVADIKRAWDKEQKEDYEKHMDRVVDKDKITFKQFVDTHWMPDHVIQDHTPSSIQFFEYTAAKAVDYFGDKKKLKDIDTEAVKRYINSLKKTPTKTTGQPFGATTIKHFYGTLKNIMRYAKRMHYITADPCEDLAPKEKPQREKKPIDFMTPEQAKQFLACLEKEDLFWRCMMNLMLFTGLRRGEAVALQWRDLDSKKLELSVVRNVTLDKNSETGFNVGKTKTGEARVVPISTRLDTLLTSLKAEREKAMSPKDENGDITTQITLPGTSYIFCNTADPFLPIRPDSVTTKIRRFVEKNNLPNVSAHDLRHSAAALALESGEADIKQIQELLGHKDPETTMRYYAGVTEAAKRRAVEGIESLIASK